MTGKIVVYGGNGALGSVIVKHFKGKNWWVGSIDLVSNGDADCNVIVDKDATWAVQTRTVIQGLEVALEGEKVDAIVNVAGGWAGGNATSKDFQANCELMWKQSVWSSTISAEASGKFLKEGGLLSLPGAQPALNGTPGMIGYGLAKAAVHHLTKSLGCEKGGLPKETTALSLLPVTLDTPMNRKWMAAADKSTWTSLDYVAEMLFKWSEGDPKDRPKSGSLVQLITQNGETKLVLS